MLSVITCIYVERLDTVDSEIFAGILFFVKYIKRHISDMKISRLRQDFPISINDRVILPFCEGFIFAKLRETSRKFLNLQ